MAWIILLVPAVNEWAYSTVAQRLVAQPFACPATSTQKKSVNITVPKFIRSYHITAMEQASLGHHTRHQDTHDTRTPAHQDATTPGQHDLVHSRRSTCQADPSFVPCGTAQARPAPGADSPTGCCASSDLWAPPDLGIVGRSGVQHLRTRSCCVSSHQAPLSHSGVNIQVYTQRTELTEHIHVCYNSLLS